MTSVGTDRRGVDQRTGDAGCADHQSSGEEGGTDYLREASALSERSHFRLLSVVIDGPERKDPALMAGAGFAWLPVDAATNFADGSKPPHRQSLRVACSGHHTTLRGTERQ